MRLSPWVCAAALAVAAGAVQAPAQAAPPAASAPAAVAPSVQRTGPATGRVVTLVTGERVRVSGRAGHEQVVVVHRDAAARDALVVRRSPQHLYVYPVGLEPLLGRTIDPALFDVRAARADQRGRMAVRVAYTGSRPSLPGVHVTSDRDHVLRGYVTSRTAATFGHALLARAAARSASTTGALAGVRSVGPATSAPGTVTPQYPMKNLVVKVLDAQGQPQADGVLFLVNVDNGQKYANFAFVTKGEARVSVPTGTYSAISDDFVEGKTDGTGVLTVVTVNEYVVTGAGQTLTIDHRTATRKPAAGTPLPADPVGLFFEWDRGDAADSFGLGAGYFVEPGLDFRVAPSAPAKVGTLSIVEDWSLAERGATNPSYTYSLASEDDHIPSEAGHTYSAAELATVTTTYDGDGSGATGATGASVRLASFDDGGGGGVDVPVTLGSRRTEYVGSTSPAVWDDLALQDVDSYDDPGIFEGVERALPAGSTTTQEWFRGPLGAGIPVQSDDGGFCLACRSGNHLTIGLAPVLDSEPTHAGDLFTAGDGLPVARFRLYRGSKLLVDEDDSVGDYLRVPSKKATYRAVVDVDRRQVEPRLSTRSRTELTFSSAKNAGKKLPDGWDCDGPSCRVLPVLQAKASLPTNLQGQLPAGRSTVTVRVAQAQNATSSAVSSATLSYRPAGLFWIQVPLKRVSEGLYTGVIDTTDYTDYTDTPATVADLQVSATDKAGSTFDQTVSRAFSVAAK